MEEKELLEKNRFTEEEYKKKVKEQFAQMLEDIEMEETRKKQKRKANADMRKLKRMVQNKKEVELYDDHEAYTINNDLLKAIDKQAEELGWLDEKTCTNLSEFDSIDEFECSNCGIVLSEYQQIEIDEDDGERFFYDYRPKYCPNCGRKIVD